MFDLGWSELLLVAVLAIIFIGPKDLPRLMRTLGQYTARMKAMAREFQQSFEELARESELEDLRREISELRNHATKPLEDIRKNIETNVDAAMAQPAKAAATETAPAPLAVSEEAPEKTSEAAADAHGDGSADESAGGGKAGTGAA
jgi:sec-independent protein translocase protein TatB